VLLTWPFAAADTMGLWGGEIRRAIAGTRGCVATVVAVALGAVTLLSGFDLAMEKAAEVVDWAARVWSYATR